MAKIFIEETTLSNIGDAIRDKEGTSDLIPVNDMASRISAITTGGGNEPTDEELTITGDCSYRFAHGGWDWVIDKYGDRLTTKDITIATRMFQQSNVSHIPFVINLFPEKHITNCYDAFLKDCGNLRELPVLNVDTSKLKMPTSSYDQYTCPTFDGLKNVRTIPYDYLTQFFPEGYQEGRKTLAAQGYTRGFANCYSLRNTCDMTPLMNYTDNGYYNSLYYYSFPNCNALDALSNIPVEEAKYNSSNVFLSTFNGCWRVNSITFEKNANGTCKTVEWSKLTIDLTQYVGYGTLFASEDFAKYNSGITADKLVYNDATYQALKNNPDWFTYDPAYSRYNHDSAVETINSLPNASAYGTNTIKFKGAAGSKTDGGAISTLTEAEIAVAAAKGWTVTFA